MPGSSGFRGGRFAGRRVPKIRELFRRRARAVLDEGLDSPREYAAREHDPVPTAETDKPDVRAEPDYFPVRAAAWVGLPQAYDVVKRNIEWHHRTPHQAARIIQHFLIQQRSIAQPCVRTRGNVERHTEPHDGRYRRIALTGRGERRDAGIQCALGATTGG